MEQTASLAHSLPRARRNELILEAGLITLVALLSSALYVSRIGFYSDDWFYIGALFRHAPDRSFPGLLWQFTDTNSLPRPVWVVEMVGLYYFFGLNPLGYNVVNSLTIALAGVLFHIVLRELRLTARLALAITLVFVLLPYATATRFWYSVHTANLSTLFFCLSLYADLRLLRAQPARRGAWHLLGILGLLLSVLAYELTIPLFALTPLVLWYHRRTLVAAGQATAGPRTPLVIFARNMVLLIAALGFKAYTTHRIEKDFNLAGQIAWFATLQLDVFKSMVAGPYGYRMPLMAKQALSTYFDPTALALSAVVAAVVFVLLFWWPTRHDEPLPGMRHMLALLLTGIFFAAAGYGIFLTNRQAILSPTGINSRSSGGAIFGIALFIVGGAGVAARLLRNERLAQLAFALLVAGYAGGSTLAVSTLGDLWAAANAEQHTIMGEIKTEFPTLAPGSTLILDGFCPYIGPGIIFEAQWDTTGMLRILYDDPTVNGDVVSPRLEVREDGIYTRMYQLHEVRTPRTEAAARAGQLRRLELVPFFIHPYDKLWIYNRLHHVVMAIPSAAAANAYFIMYNPSKDSGCPHYRAGSGGDVW
ncbi:MAG: hypothetical protein HGA45_34275 [Chloroflexales bacterium]|nr:hypothetical protein [Chloroflexales bacterium]